MGLVAPFEGRYRYVGYDVIYAVRLALAEVNDSGGVCGYGVELVAYDDGADPSLALEQVRKLDVDPDVVGALGHFREATTAAASDVYIEAGMPFLMPTHLSRAGTMSEGVHALGPSADWLADALLGRAVELAGDEPVVLLGDGGALTEALLRAAQRRAIDLCVTSPETDGWEREVMAERPAVLLSDLDPVPAGEVVSVLREAGWAGEVLGGPALAAADFVAVGGASATGTLFLTPWPFPEDVPGGEAFIAAYADVSDGATPGPLALPAYRGTQVMLEALAQAATNGAPSRERVLNALAELEREGRLGRTAGWGRRLGADEGSVSAEGELAWYRIGPEGAPRLIGTVLSSQRVEP